MTDALPAPSAASGRRFLLTGVVSRYHHDPSWNREELADDLRRMVELFTGELGYEHVPVMGLDPTWLQIQDALRDFCTSEARLSADYVTVYLAGHGEILQVGDTGVEHVLLPADVKPTDLRRRAVKSADLAEWMLADTPVRRLLLIVDTCYSGQGGLDFARNALARIGTSARPSEQDSSGVVVITATQPAQQAVAGAFTAAFARAVRHQATAGHAPGALSIDAVMRILKADPELPPSQQAQWSLLAGSDVVPEFLPNPRRDTGLIDLDLAEQNRRWRARLDHEHQRAEEMRGQFVPRITGFTGRHRALADITRWLDTPADTRPMIVTGDPGSGKTAVLGILAALTDPRRRPTIPRDGLPVNAVPLEEAIGVAIYAGNLTAGQVLAGLSTAAGIDGINPDPAALGGGVARLLSGLHESGRPLTAMIDALDEAADLPHLAEQLLRPLMERGSGLIRLLLGTRRHACEYLGRGWRDRCQVIDLDSHHYADPVAMAAVVGRILTTGTSARGMPTANTGFASCPRAVLDAVTAAITEVAGHSFFVARILATTQASQVTIANPADPVWRDSLPKTAGPAMRQDLEIRLGDQTTRAIDLLRPLAYAQGTGLPWEDVWAPLANALASGQSYTNEDLLWLAGHAGSFIVEGGTISGRSVYRLYHRSLAEDLIAHRNHAADEHAITTMLTLHVPRRFSGRPDWPASHPYIRAYLATHAARSGDIDDLAQDPGFLLAADPPQLLAALDTAASAPARAAAGAYRDALPLIRRHPPTEHAAYLGLAARCRRAESLADRLDADGLGGPWRASWASWRLQRPHQQLTGHGDAVLTVTTAELNGRPVIVSGGRDRTVRVSDLATGNLVGKPFTGHRGWVRSVAAAELDGRPVIISASSDRTVQVWDLATGRPVSALSATTATRCSQ
ncbi:MAG TPA: caspase family protein [Streptosporangiaceae bacterium]|nr:caspase family protein [Streptosporangiaceae bacterium]